MEMCGHYFTDDGIVIDFKEVVLMSYRPHFTEKLIIVLRTQPTPFSLEDAEQAKRVFTMFKAWVKPDPL